MMIPIDYDYDKDEYEKLRIRTWKDFKKGEFRVIEARVFEALMTDNATRLFLCVPPLRFRVQGEEPTPLIGGQPGRCWVRRNWPVVFWGDISKVKKEEIKNALESAVKMWVRGEKDYNFLGEEFTHDYWRYAEF